MKKTIIILMLFSAQISYGHGENKPGPHKGFVRMPGAFHTEVVPDGNAKFKVYLLDIEWKNPSVKDSKLDVKIVDKEKTANVVCALTDDHYSCQLPLGFSLKKGQLILSTVRENSAGVDMAYDLPLTFHLGTKTKKRQQ